MQILTSPSTERASKCQPTPEWLGFAEGQAMIADKPSFAVAPSHR